MTSRDYYERLNEIKENMDNLSDEEFKALLDELSAIKPIRLDLLCLETDRMLMKPEKHRNLLEKIIGKYNSGIGYQGVERALALTRDIYRNSNSEYNARRMECKLALLKDDYSDYDKLYSKCRAYNWKRIKHDDVGLNLLLYMVEDIVTYILHGIADEKLAGEKTCLPTFDWIFQQVNMGFWKAELCENRNNPFVLIENENNKFIIEFIKNELLILDKTIFYINRPLRYANNNVPIEKTVEISIDTLKQDNGIWRCTPIEVCREDGCIESNLDLVLDGLWKKFSGESYMNVVSDGLQFEILDGCNKLIRLSTERGEHQSLNMCYGIYGDYLSYISRIYNEDCRELLNCEPKKRFSIVIPARNSASTLRYTVQTCLDQTYQGEYEIIISDNSTDNNTEVYNLCQELNDERIVYIKTPRDLHLPKSFEFAYLHSVGEYVFALGSDDGLLPWALEILDAVTGTYPNEEILQWERGFYGWPGFNGGQEHQFIIPDEYVQGKLRLFYRSKENYLSAVLKNPANMYGLPMLYINSCFKRNYFKTLLQKTGRLWDGMCQDIYMGVVTVGLHEKILNMRYPLSVAGMSSGSVGANANRAKVTNEEFDKMVKMQKNDNNVGGYCRSYMEGFVPNTGTDISSLYGCLMRAISVGALSAEVLLENIDWKDIFQNLYKELDIRDVAYEKKIHEMRCVASKHGTDFLEWFDEGIYEPALTPIVVDRVIVSNAMKKKCYKEGKLENGGLILDASKYDVTNVYDATKLFKELSGLT